MGEFKCRNCQNVYSMKIRLDVHEKNQHSIGNQRVICDICERLFSNQFSLNRHNKNVHKVNNNLQKQCRLMCPYNDCDKKLSNYKFLRGHLLGEHNVEIYLEIAEFTSFADFENWKKQVELETLSRYTLDTSPKKSTINKTERRYYSCHRSYNYRPKGNGIRSLKYAGSSKMGKACPARMEVTITEEEEVSVKVNFYKTHLGHSLELDHIPLDKKSRNDIVDMMKNGHTFDQILESVKDSSTIREGYNKRLSLIRRKDLHNIAREFRKQIKTNGNDVKGDIKMEKNTNKNISMDQFGNNVATRQIQVQEDLELVDNTEYDGNQETEQYMFIKQEPHDTECFSNSIKIIGKTECIIDICNKIEISNEKCELVSKHLDEVVNILQNESGNES